MRKVRMKSLDVGDLARRTMDFSECDMIEIVIQLLYFSFP